MSKLAVYTIATVVVLVGTIGGYLYFAKSEIVQVEVPSAPPAAPTPATSKQLPNHGSFEKRFEPKPPPANGGRNN